MQTMMMNNAVPLTVPRRLFFFDFFVPWVCFRRRINQFIPITGLPDQSHLQPLLLPQQPLLSPQLLLLLRLQVLKTVTGFHSILLLLLMAPMVMWSLYNTLFIHQGGAHLPPSMQHGIELHARPLFLVNIYSCGTLRLWVCCQNSHLFAEVMS